MPQASAVWSADPRQMWSFPARFLVEFFDNHGMLGLRDRPQWRTVRAARIATCEALTAPWRDEAASRHAGARASGGTSDHVELTRTRRPPSASTRSSSRRTPTRRSSSSPTRRTAERELLGAIPYQANEAVLHTDTRLLPRRRRAWASWNYHLLDEPIGKPTVTYHMNRLQSLRTRHRVLRDAEPLARRSTPTRSSARSPTRTPSTPRRARTPSTATHEISGQNRTHYCGAYWGWGFHEDGVKSGERVAEALR